MAFASLDSAEGQAALHLLSIRSRREDDEVSCASWRTEELWPTWVPSAGSPVTVSSASSYAQDPYWPVASDPCPVAGDVPSHDGPDGQVAYLAFRPDDCRLVQNALLSACPRRAFALAMELRGLVRQALANPWANHCVRAVVKALPSHELRFALAEIEGFVEKLSKQKYGCRVVIEILKSHSWSDPFVATIAGEAAAGARRFSTHEFGHYVFAALLEHSPDKSDLVDILLKRLSSTVVHKHGSWSVEAALSHAPPSLRDDLAHALVSKPMLMNVVNSRFGWRVAVSVAKCGTHFRDAVQACCLASQSRWAAMAAASLQN